MDLPDELLDDVLRRVPPRHLAACRRVCKNWRAVIDGRGLILTHLAPRPLHGIFVDFYFQHSHSFFSRPASTSPCIDHTFCFLPNWWMFDSKTGVLDHQNGLFLWGNMEAMYVCNPATRRWATLPLPPPPIRHSDRNRVYLRFDPTVSLHYDVLFFPVPHMPEPPLMRPRKIARLLTSSVPHIEKPSRANYEHGFEPLGSMEWPPYSYAVQVFSSRTGRWEERRFVREGDAVATVSDVWSDRCHAVYWQGAFFVHYPFGGVVIRFSLMEEKYLVIKSPTSDIGFHCRKSKHGVYYTAIDKCELWIWVLHDESESRPTPEWELKHQADLESSLLSCYTRKHIGQEIDEHWVLLNGREGGSEDSRGAHGWDSDDDSVVDAEGRINNVKVCMRSNRGMCLLGYHPYKEIVFLVSGYDGFVYAYYVGSSKLQCLGSLGAPRLINSPRDSFMYTPCMDDLLPVHNDP